MNILVVDDEKFNLVLAKDILEEQIKGCKVILCQFPAEVMLLLAKEEIGVILLDIVMPQVNGIDLLKEIRSKDEYKDVQIMMFTGVTDQESFRSCFESGANDFISKPINVTEFVARMRSAVNTREHILTLRQMFATMAEQYNELQDVTKQLQDAQFYLIQQEKLASLGEIAAGVAHEINNPIGFVNSNLATLGKYVAKICQVFMAYHQLAALLTEERVDIHPAVVLKQQVEALETDLKLEIVLADMGPLIVESQDGVDRVVKIVNSLRNFARTGGEDEMAVNDLNQILEEALLITLNEVKYVAQVKKDFAPLPGIVCNKGQIGQVVINILINAAQAIKSLHREELGHIQITTFIEGDFVVCRLTDDGPGMTSEVRGRIFDPFFTTKEIGSGTGLGLSIAYGIIKRHGGELLVESDIGQGATFFIRLPLGEHAVVEVEGDRHGKEATLCR